MCGSSFRDVQWPTKNVCSGFIGRREFEIRALLKGSVARSQMALLNNFHHLKTKNASDGSHGLTLEYPLGEMIC